MRPRFAREEAAARLNGIGLWAGDFERPADWRRSHQAGLAVGDGEHSQGFWAFIGRWLGVN